MIVERDGRYTCTECGYEWSAMMSESQIPRYCSCKVFKVKDLETGEVFKWSIEQILEEINRDRSEAWTSYDENDWEEGWSEWCEGDCYTLLKD